MGVLNAAGLAAFLIVGLPAGAWVDRWLKRPTMIRADLARMTAMAAVPLLWWGGVLEIWHLYVIAAIVGTATVFFDVSYQSYVPVLVAPGQVNQANSKLEGTAQIARIGGPAAGGLLLAVVTAPVLFVGEAVGYLLSATFLARTRDREVAAEVADRRPLRVEIKEGLAFVIRHPLISRIAACTAAMNFCGMMIFTMMPVLILRNLGLGAQGMGLVMAVGAAGGLLGAVAAPRVAARVGEGTVIPLCAVASSVFLVPLPLAAMASEPGVSLALLLLSELLLRLRGPDLQHHAAQHAPARVSAPPAGKDECVHPVRCLGSDAAGRAGVRCPRRAPWPHRGDLDRNGGQFPGGRTGGVLAVAGNAHAAKPG